MRHGVADHPRLSREVEDLVVMLAQIHFIQGEAGGARLEGKKHEQSQADPEADGVVPGKSRHEERLLILVFVRGNRVIANLVR